jgi:DNA-binding FadR family transcriptional regulator
MSDPQAAAGLPRTDELFRTQPRAYEAIAHELLVQILGGHLGPGTRLPSERQLAARFGVSRPTVREALGALEARGVVVTRVGSGTFVAERDALDQAPDPSADDSPAEFMETRLVLEVAVARLAAKRAAVRRDGLEELRLSVEALERVADPEALPDELDRDFHRGIVGLTGNEHLIALLEPMWETMRQALYTTLGRRSWSPEHTQRTAVEHRAIYEALRAGDPELAAFAMERHLRALMATLLEDEAFEGPPPRFFA